MGTDQRILEIEKRLAELHRERQQLLAELGLLREDEQLTMTSLGPLGSAASEAVPTEPEEKVSLFLKLFRCRESVYPRLWENHKQGKKGYAPACSNEWREGVCDKPRIKCSDCSNQAFIPLDETAIRRHLEGKETVGTYAIRQDDTCTFLAADFDGDGWKDDVSAYKTAGSEIGVQVAVERSRSGNGAHAWIFFQEPVQAHLARQLGTVIVARATASSPSMKLGTYDRFFPNQDYLPKGGFGNLIALPLQRRARESQNSVFIDDSFQVIPDQWSTLASAKRLSYLELRTVLDKTIPKEKGPAFIRYEDQGIRLAERVLDSGRRKVKAGCYPGQIEISLDSHTRINITGLPKSIVAAFKRTATFANPIFFEKERMRFSTWNVPRFVSCGEIQGELLSLPRGVLDQCLEICGLAGSSVVLKDQRPHHKKLKLAFSGELTSEQKKTVSAICGQDTGVLVAPPGAGKTVMACAVMARRKARTLVLVHRMQLLEQWKKQISRFLVVSEKEIGVIASAKRKQTGRIRHLVSARISDYSIKK